MQKTNHTIEDKIVSAKPAELSATEEAMVFSKAFARHTSGKTESVFASLFLTQSKTMIPLVLIVALLLGAGGTVAASDGARPGDLLFPVDRAVEDLKLTFASDEGKNELRIKFANERVKEFDEIADDETGDDDISGTLTEVEADIFTNETVVKLEAGDRKVTFITDADTREEIIDVIHDRYGFSTEEIDALLNLETEDRESRPEDRGESASAVARLEDAVDVLGDFIEKNRDAASTSPDVLAALALIEARLFDRSAFFPEEVRVKVRDDRARYEVRGEDGQRVRVEIKDGEIRIKTKDNDDDDDRDEDEDEDDNDERDGVSTGAGFLQVEADVFTDKTVVVVELNDRKTTFTLASTTTRAGVIEEVEDRFPSLTRSEIDSALDFEVEDRASRADDLNTNDDEDDSDDEDDDDSSGRGSDDDDEDEDDDSDDENELEIEAEVHSSSTSVEVELNDVKTRFSTTATTRAGIIDAIEARFSELSESEIDGALELEFDEEDEDDSSSGGDSDDDSDDDEDEDEDEDEDDDDRSGRGGGDEDDEDDDN